MKLVCRRLLNALPKNLNVPSTGKSVPVRIEVSGEFFANVSSPGSLIPSKEAVAGDPEYSRRVRPVCPGYSVGTTEVSGTVGVIVISTSDNQLYVASNNHLIQ